MPRITRPGATLPVFLFLTVALFLAVPAEAHGQTARLIAGTPHDFSQNVSVGQNGCEMCHLPLADEGNKGGGEGFEVYAMNSVVGPDGMGSVTRLCLSCHDGVGASGDVAPTMGGGAGHPVSVEYDRFSKDMHTPESVEAQGVKLHRSGGQYRVECTSCHSPHDNGNGKFLRISNQGSAMCLTCHDK